MILIYCPDKNARVTWTLDLVFRQLLGLDYELTTIVDELVQSEGLKLNYSNGHIPGIPFIEASTLLFEQGTSDQSSKLVPGKPWHGLPVIFPTGNPGSALPFDPFAAVFYFVSRYEEYLPYVPDVHQRFKSADSLSFKLDVIEKPIVNLWIKELGELMKVWYGQALILNQPEYQFIPTIDVDNAWAYAHKGVSRTIGGLWKDRHDMEARNFRFQVLRNNQPDPYNTYGLLDHFHKDAKVHPVWFFQVGPYGLYDKNISPKNPHFQILIKSIAAEYAVGVHPSYRSDSKQPLVNHEIEILSQILGHPVKRSRQHYLRMHLPQTYRILADLGIREEYSMGFAECPGFRAGIASPFRFFDLFENKNTDLTVYPFQVMDTSLRQYLKLTPGQAIDKIRNLVNTVKNANGTFISLWHNDSMSEWKNWRGWSEVYRELLLAAKTD